MAMLINYASLIRKNNVWKENVFEWSGGVGRQEAKSCVWNKIFIQILGAVDHAAHLTAGFEGLPCLEGWLAIHGNVGDSKCWIQNMPPGSRCWEMTTFTNWQMQEDTPHELLSSA